MAEALALAEKGAGRTSPNPMVGAIVVKNGAEVGRGWHQRAGGPHAEVIALREASERARGATLYVNLEPCSHYGKTPPCVQDIVDAGIATVVCAMEDPNPRVNGAGIRHLRTNGIGVRIGVLRRAAMRLNEAHIKFSLTGKPLVTLKISETLDGKIATLGGRRERVSGVEAQRFVHLLRARYDAVLVGRNTVMLDDPYLTVREVKGRDPIRIVLDSWAKLPVSANVFTENDDGKTVRASLVMGKRPDTAPHPNCLDWYLDHDAQHQIDLHELLDKAAQNNITSIMVEGGGEVFGSFIREKLADKIHLIISTRFLGGGVSITGRWKAPSLDEALRLVDSEVRWLGPDLLVTGYPDYEPQAEETPSAQQEEERNPSESSEPGSVEGVIGHVIYEDQPMPASAADDSRAGE
jgi:diaminohydroxyphosphoribosylaminopyrimidine deaminase/5-amino-6-(5-phosphoribosylamino)uracil reductase